MLQSIFLFSFSRRELLRIGKAFYNYSQKTLASIDLMGYNKVIVPTVGRWELMGIKNLVMLVWLTQLGISVAGPPVVFILLSVWLRDSFSLGNWVVWIGVAAGLLLAICGLRDSLKAMDRIVRQNKKEEDKLPPPVNFNDHD